MPSDRKAFKVDAYCSFTPADHPRLKIEKNLVPSSDPGKFNLDVKKFAMGQQTDVSSATEVGDGGDTGFVNVEAGSTYRIREQAFTGTSLTNYTTTISCDNNLNPAGGGPTSPNGSSVKIPDNSTQDFTCTITNTRKGTRVKVIKHVNPTNDPGTFDLEINGSVVVSNAKHGDESAFVSVSAGDVTVSESGFNTADYNSSISCDNGQSVTNATSIEFAVQDGVPDVTCTITNTRKTTPPSPKGTIKISKIKDAASDADADNPEFSFVVDDQPVATKLLVGGSTSVQVSAGPAHSVAEVALPANWSLTGATCDNGQSPGSVVVSTGGVVTCTFKNKFSTPRDPRMEEETKRFIHRRVDNLLTHGPDRARMLRRLQEGDPPQSLKDGGSIKDAPMKFGGGIGQARGSQGLLGSGQQALGLASVEQQLGSDEETRDITNPTGQATRNPFFDALAGQASRLGATQNAFKFGTSLSQLREMASLQEDAKQKAKLADSGLAFHDQSMSGPYLVPRTGFDVWIEGHVSRYKDDIGGVNRDGDFRILYVGADYVLAPGILIGALVQVDDTTEDIKNNPGVLGETGSIDGTGWMAGPYIGVRLNESLFFDARAAWGKSSNDIFLQDAVNGARHGSFDTTRWLASATLTGTERRGNWRFSPQVGIAYGHEEYDTYKNSLNQTINGGEASIGRVTGGIEIGYQFRTQYGTTIEPHVSITGIYNFDTDDLVINGVQIQSDESRAKIEGGVTVMTPTGWGVRAAAHFDGIGGQDFESYGGSLWLNVPLN